jgi:hypothetical protein
MNTQKVAQQSQIDNVAVSGGRMDFEKTVTNVYF